MRAPSSRQGSAGPRAELVGARCRRSPPASCPAAAERAGSGEWAAG
uniref:Uncharacterized protein n=1 Tax=Arundo donax TaxID=35708 RepID=A0A0A8Z3V7_ARUDO